MRKVTASRKMRKRIQMERTKTAKSLQEKMMIVGKKTRRRRKARGTQNRKLMVTLLNRESAYQDLRFSKMPLHRQRLVEKRVILLMVLSIQLLLMEIHNVTRPSTHTLMSTKALNRTILALLALPNPFFRDPLIIQMHALQQALLSHTQEVSMLLSTEMKHPL